MSFPNIPISNGDVVTFLNSLSSGSGFAAGLTSEAGVGAVAFGGIAACATAASYLMTLTPAETAADAAIDTALSAAMPESRVAAPLIDAFGKQLLSPYLAPNKK